MIRDNDLLNEELEGYRVTARHGSPIFNSTFLGESISSITPHQRVIIKLLSTAVHTQQERQDILHKISALQQMDHPHILPILSVGFHKDVPYIITKYLPLGSLHGRFQRRRTGQPTAQEEALLTLMQVGQALHYAHQQGVIHGYLKPQDVLFNMQDEVQVTGFHQYALSLPDETEDTRPLELSIYLAPEQLAGQASAKSDQYALGCLAYALFTGYKVFMVPSVKTPGTYYKTKSLIPPRRLNTALPSYIEEAILKALAKEPDQRYHDIPAFLAALKVSPASRQREQYRTGVHLAQIMQGEIPGLPPMVNFADRQFTNEALPLDTMTEKDDRRSDALAPLSPDRDGQFAAVTLSDVGLLNVPDAVQSEGKQLPFKSQQSYAEDDQHSFNKGRKRRASNSQRTFAVIICLLIITIVATTMLFMMSFLTPPKQAGIHPPIRGVVTVQSLPKTSRSTPIVTKQGVSSSPGGATIPPQDSNTGAAPEEGPIPYPTSPPPSGSLGFTQGVNSVSPSQAQFWFAPNGWQAAYVILHYTDTGQVQQNIQMASNGNLWQYTVSGLNSAQTITYWFSYQQNGTQYDSGTYVTYMAGSGAPAPTAIPTPAPPTRACSGNFSHGVNSIGSSQGQFWFSPCGWIPGYVIIHYTGTGQAQQNIQMVSSEGGNLWQYTVSGLNSTETLTYWFTYQQNGTQYDSGTYTWAHP
jgi:serine/threonine protein kinase